LDAGSSFVRFGTGRRCAQLRREVRLGLEVGQGRVTGQLTEYAENPSSGLKAVLSGGQAMAEGKSPMRAALSAGGGGAKDKVMGALGMGGDNGGSGRSGGGGGSGKMKFANIVEYIDVGVPITVAYNQWTQFGDWTDFMKKVESAEQESEEKVNFKGQVMWSHRTWNATIIEQLPDDHIVWQSSGQKGHIDGAVTFHEIAPRLTRIVVVLEYSPQGLVEKTANIWRAAGRRARLELKHYQRHVMTQTILEPDEVEGWRGEIRDSEVVKSHEDAVEEESETAEGEEADGGEEQEEALPEDEYAEGEEADEYEEYEEQPEGRQLSSAGRRR
jgi:hypothetical protein